MKGRIISVATALLLLAALIYVSGPREIAQILSRINIFVALGGLGLLAVGAILRTKRWMFLLDKADIKVPFWTAMKVYISSLFLSNITPGKSGDPIRSVILKKVSGESVSKSLPSIIVERAFDVGSMVAIGLVGMGLLATSATSTVMSWFMAAIAIYVIIFFLAIFSISSESRAMWSADKVKAIASRLPKIKNYSGKAEGFIMSMQESLSAYGGKRTILVGAAYSLAIWIFEGLIVYVSFLSLGFDVPVISAIAALSVTTLISVLTFLPGGLGSSEVISVAFFTSLTTLTMADVTAAAILARLLSYWAYVVVGALLLSVMKYNYKV